MNKINRKMARQDRLAQALRENLKRRKQQHTQGKTGPNKIENKDKEQLSPDRACEPGDCGVENTS